MTPRRAQPAPRRGAPRAAPARASRLRRASPLVAALLLPNLAAGCGSLNRPQPIELPPLKRPVTLPDEVWPDRWPTTASRKGIVLEEPVPWQDAVLVSLGRQHHRLASPHDREQVARLAQQLGYEGEFQFELERGGSIVLQQRPPEARRDPRLKGPPPDRILAFVSATPAGSDPDPPMRGRPRVSVQRTWFALYEPTADRLIGTAVVLPGLFGTPGFTIDPLIADLRSRGFAVVRMLAPPSRYIERDEFSALAAFDGRLLGRELGQLGRQRFAETAYAVEAVLEHLQQGDDARRFPSPRVMVAMSGGALAAPAVAVRTPGSFDATVLIAGGANFAVIAGQSNYRDGIGAVGFAGDAERRARASGRAITLDLQAYFRANPLDPSLAVFAYRDQPVLLVHGTRDRAVPAESGDALFQALTTGGARVERLEYPVGHEVLFLIVAFKTDTIADWLVEQIQPENAPAPP